MTALLDGNVLIALAFSEHSHHASAQRWLPTVSRFATCPTVQGALLRFLVRQGFRPATGLLGLRAILDLERHEQWFDDLTYAQVDLSRVLGHAQVTDAYLAQLARSRGGRVATFDRGFAASAPDVVDLLTA